MLHLHLPPHCRKTKVRRGVCCAKVHGKLMETFNLSCMSYRDRKLTCARPGTACRAHGRRCRGWRQADSGELAWLAGGTGEGANGSGRKVDTWSLLWRWRIGERRAVLVYACLQRRMFGAGFVYGFMGLGANGSGCSGNWQAIGRLLGEGKARGWQARQVGLSDGRRSHGGG